ncbi:MAG: queuosine precursor transporter [Bacteroides sp.]|nr:queuosine precursor transporter [Prevotella sp.]MCM1408429.1 queuosine precursor transporter [Treponema brennaborense]MCM1469409.1 queuosine precursor transporter [Bacteroides sp.]
MLKNEMLLVCSLLISYGGVLVFFKLFKEVGLYFWTIIATVAANIEVLILIRAFGLEQTLGNVLFASTFLVTDILSELYGKKEARRSVYAGIAASLAFIVLSQLWLMYTPSADDRIMPAMRAVFSNTPRMMIAGILVYAVVQFFDVFLYHRWWQFTERKTGNKRRFLWLRNNGSTLVSQLLNAVLFTFAAFGGTYDAATLLSIIVSSYAVFIATSLADTPFVYAARRLAEKESRKKS